MISISGDGWKISKYDLVGGWALALWKRLEFIWFHQLGWWIFPNCFWKNDKYSSHHQPVLVGGFNLPLWKIWLSWDDDYSQLNRNVKIMFPSINQIIAHNNHSIGDGLFLLGHLIIPKPSSSMATVNKCSE